MCRNYVVLNVLFYLIWLVYGAAPLDAASAKSAEKVKSSSDVKKLIKEAGSTKPDWWDQVQLNYPQTLDFTTIVKASGGWNNKKNVGQWIWDVINPSESKWKEGAKTIHLIRTTHKDDPQIVEKSNISLGRIYHDLLQDYARAAYYYEQALADQKSKPLGIMIDLADCYFRLGNSQMAEATVKGLNIDPTEHGSLIQFYADLGDYKMAEKLAAGKVHSDEALGLLKLGDLCRVQSQYDKALAYYEKAAKADKKKSGRRYDETVRRANENVKAIQLYEQFDLSKTKDGVYTDKSFGYSGDVEVEVTIKAAAITTVKITKHIEKQYYSSFIEMPRRIIDSQSIKGVDGTLGATITAEAILNATAKAVHQGHH